MDENHLFFTFYLRSFHLDIHHHGEENMFTVSVSCWRNQNFWLKFDLIFHDVAVDKCSLLKQMTQTIIRFHVFIEHAEWNNERFLIYNSFHCRCGCASSWWEVHHHLCVLPLRRYAPYPRRPGWRQSQCEYFPHHFKMTQLPLNNPFPDLGSQHIVQLIFCRTKSNKTNEAFLWMRFLKVSCPWKFPHYCWIASVSSLSDDDKMIVMYSETHSRPRDFISFVQHTKRSLGECSCCSFQYSYSEWGLKVRSHLLLLGEMSQEKSSRNLHNLEFPKQILLAFKLVTQIHRLHQQKDAWFESDLCKMCFIHLYAINSRQWTFLPANFCWNFTIVTL